MIEQIPTSVPNQHQLLRSINIVFDADHPERIAHYFPTTKSIQLLKNLLVHNPSSSYFVVAPYGSGKSLLGSYYMHVIENKPKTNSVLKPVLEQLEPIDFVCYSAIKHRQKQEIKGITVPLNGFVDNLPQAIYNGIIEGANRIGEQRIVRKIKGMTVSTISELLEVMSAIRSSFGDEVIDHLDIVWDEFGRHLEELVSQGDAQRLNELQALAEFSSRSKKLSISLILFLHQSLMRYATNVPRTVTDEWKKIEARFETIQFIDNSKEITLLVSRVLGTLFSDIKPSARTLSNILLDIEASGLFHELTENEIHQLIVDAYPVLPAALYLLPLISSRVAQNERTLFSFLFSLQSEDRITAAEVFDYFSDLMRSDTTFGGTFQHWLETQNALEKSDSVLQERIIKTLSLLSLGLSGERNRVSREVLALLVKNYQDDLGIETEIETLIERKLLLPRKNSNSIMLWHGNDIDLRGKIEAKVIEIYHSFNLTEYINQYLPLEGWRPLEYNIQKNMTRFYNGVGVSCAELMQVTSTDDLLADQQADGIILYIIPDSEDSIEQVIKHILTHFSDPRVVALLPKRVENLFSVAVEARAIENLLSDTALIAEDPLVEPELKLMLDDAQTYLMRSIDTLFIPSVDGPIVICNGKQIHAITTKHAFRQLLSENMYQLYPETPAFNNELINKKNPTRVIVNARKKLVLGILDRYGTPNLGLEGNRPDKSMFDTLLIQTGLYHEIQDGHWALVSTDQIDDKYLRKFWTILEDFFSTPSKLPKTFDQLYTTLTSPPLGVREGVLPIFTAIGFRAFPSAISLTGPNGEYIQDIKPSIIEEIYTNPKLYSMVVVELSEDQTDYLRTLITVFDDQPETIGKETDLIRRCYDAMEVWKTSLPPAAFISRKFTRPTLMFQRLISRNQNPAQLFLEDFFTSFGLVENEWEKLISHIIQWKNELENITDQYYDTAKRTIISALQMGDDDSLIDAGKTWTSVLPGNFGDLLHDDLSKAVIERFNFPYDNDKLLIDSISSLLIGKRTDRWDDSTITLFDREFKSLVRRIEDDILNAQISDSAEEQIAIDLLLARIRNLYSKLEGLVGVEAAQEQLEQLNNRK